MSALSYRVCRLLLIVLPLCTVFTIAQAQDATTMDEVSRLVSAGQVQQAVAVARRDVERFAKTDPGAQEHWVALAALVEALDAGQLGSTDEGVRTLRTLVEIAPKAFGPASTQHLQLANELALRHVRRQEVAEAERTLMFLDAVSNESAVVVAQPLASAFYTRGQNLLTLGKTFEAIASYRRAVTLLRSAGPEAIGDLATAENDLAFVLYLAGDVAESDALARSALVLRKSLGTDYEGLVAQSSVVGSLVATGRGELERARTLALEAGAILERHPELVALRTLQAFAAGSALAELGDGKGAVPLLERALSAVGSDDAVIEHAARIELVSAYISSGRVQEAIAVVQSLLGNSGVSPSAKALSLASGVNAYLASGQVAKARQLAFEAERTLEEAGLNASPLAVTVHMAAARAAQTAYAHDDSDTHLERALALSDKLLGETSARSIAILAARGQAQDAAGRRDIARASYREAFERSRRTNDPGALLELPLLYGLAIHLLEDDANAAFELMAEARDAFESAGLNNTVGYWFVRGFAAGDVAQRKGLEAAIQELDTAAEQLARSPELVGGMLLAFVESIRSALLGASGSLALAHTSALATLRRSRLYVRGSIRGLPHANAIETASILDAPRSLLTATSVRLGGEYLSEGFAELTLSRGVTIDDLAFRRRQTSAIPVARRAELESLQRAQAHLARLTYARVSDTSARETGVKELRDEIAKSEASLGLMGEPQNETPAAQAVRRLSQTLGGDTALVSYLKFDDVVGDRPAGATSSTDWISLVNDAQPRYAAVVLRPGLPPKATLLASGAEIDAGSEAWITCARKPPRGVATLAKGSIACTPEAQQLRALLFAPIESLILGARRLIIVPDGSLRSINFLALADAAGRPLAESDRAIAIVDFERDLLRPEHLRNVRRQIAILADPAFIGASDRKTLDGPGNVSDEGPLRAAPTCDISGLVFDRLPGTRIEAAAIRRAVETQSVGWTIDVQLGERVTKDALKSAAAKSTILHVATHGFVLNEECGRVAGEGSLPAGVTDPLLLSGLAVAVAGDRSRVATDDGIVTAAEVASWSMPQTELVVLSACDTGTGQNTSVEGVLGLRRAFMTAGSRQTVTSLWPVDDVAAADWTDLFYGELMKGSRLVAATAAQNATRAMLVSRRQNGLSLHPFYWAAFVATGTGDQ